MHTCSVCSQVFGHKCSIHIEVYFLDTGRTVRTGLCIFVLNMTPQCFTALKLAAYIWNDCQIFYCSWNHMCIKGKICLSSSLFAWSLEVDLSFKWNFFLFPKVFQNRNLCVSSFCTKPVGIDTDPGNRTHCWNSQCSEQKFFVAVNIGEVQKGKIGSNVFTCRPN